MRRVYALGEVMIIKCLPSIKTDGEGGLCLCHIEWENRKNVHKCTEKQWFVCLFHEKVVSLQKIFRSVTL